MSVYFNWRRAWLFDLVLEMGDLRAADRPHLSNCLFSELIKNPGDYKGQLVRLIARVDDYDASTQKAIVSDPLMETSETFIVDTSKATNVAIFRKDLYQFFGECREVYGQWRLETSFLKCVPSLDVNKFFEVDRMVKGYLSENDTEPISSDDHFMAAAEKMYSDLVHPEYH